YRGTARLEFLVARGTGAVRSRRDIARRVPAESRSGAAAQVAGICGGRIDRGGSPAVQAAVVFARAATYARGAAPATACGCYCAASSCGCRITRQANEAKEAGDSPAPPACGGNAYGVFARGAGRRVDAARRRTAGAGPIAALGHEC